MSKQQHASSNTFQACTQALQKVCPWVQIHDALLKVSLLDHLNDCGHGHEVHGQWRDMNAEQYSEQKLYGRLTHSFTKEKDEQANWQAADIADMEKQIVGLHSDAVWQRSVTVL